MGHTNTTGAYVQTAVNNELETLLSTGDGNRNNQLNETAFKIGTLPISLDDKQAMLEDAANRLGIPENEALSTIKSGLDAGEKNPRSMDGIGDGGTVQIRATARPSKPHKARTPVHLPALEPGVLARLKTAQTALTAGWPVPELTARGFTLELAQEFGFGLAQNGDTLIPTIDPNGQTVALKRRHCAPNADPRYSWAVAGKGLPATCSPGHGNANTVFWVEGELSALVAWAALRQAGLDIDVQGLGGTSGKPWDVGCKHVVIYCDGDEAGAKAAKKLASMALEDNAKTVRVLEPLPDLEDFCDIAARDGLEVLGAMLKGLIEDAAEVDPWPDPEPFTDALEPVPALHPDLLPTVLRAYCEDVAEDLSVPLEFIAVAVMQVYLSYIGRRVGLRLKKFSDWTCYGNVYMAIIGPPSASKTPVMNAAQAPVFAAESVRQKEFKDKKASNAVQEILLEGTLSSLKSASSKQTKELTDGDRAMKLAETLASLEALEITEPRHIVNDCTDAKLVRLLNENVCGLNQIHDELTGFLEALEKGDFYSRPLYLQLWSGDAKFIVDRKGNDDDRASIRVEAGCLGILGGIQPSKLKRFMAETYSQGSSDGFFARFLPVWPDSFGRFKYSDRRRDGEARKGTNRLFAWVRSSDFTKQGATEFKDPFADSREGGEPETRPPYFHFDDDAQEVFEEFYTETMRGLKRDGWGEPVDEFMGKVGKNLGAFALGIHLARLQSGEIKPGPVDSQTLLMSIAWFEFFTAHWKKVMGLARQATPGAMLAERVKRGEATDLMTIRELTRKQWAGLRTPAQVQAALDELEGAGWLRLEDVSKSTRESLALRLNPKIEVRKVGDSDE